MSNFEGAARVNALAGNEENGGWEAIEAQMKLIKSEWEELSTGVETRDIYELRDGIQDVLFTVYGLGHRAGFPVDQDYNEVVTSQFTKFDPDERSAALTREKYAKKGLKVIQKDRQVNGQTMIVTYSSMDQYEETSNGPRLVPEGKWLKSHRFQEPRYQPLPDDVQLALQL